MVNKLSVENAHHHISTLAEEILLDDGFHLEAPISQVGLSIVPILSSEEDSGDEEYINAAIALERGDLVLIEAGDAVETILARNIGKVPILIEESEVLVAANSQDRIVVQSVLIEPGKEIRIPVKCVHAPHFLNRGEGFSSIGAGGIDLKSGMRKQKYCSIMTDVEHYVPESAVDQSEVWERVEKYCRVMGVEDPTQYAQAMEEVQKRVSEIADDIKSNLPKNTCGLIIVDKTGEVVAVELYRRPKAFEKRLGFIESVLMEFSDPEHSALEKEAAWAKAVQLLLSLKDMTPESAAAKSNTSNVVIGLKDLKGEAVLKDIAQKRKNRVLYFSLSK